MTQYIRKHFATANHMRTICEILREIYWATKDEAVREKVVEAEAMAKRMDAKLHEYKYGWDEDFYEEITQEEALIRAKQRLQQYEDEQDV